MEFRADAKEIKAHKKKLDDLKVFRDRAIYRVDWCYS